MPGSEIIGSYALGSELQQSADENQRNVAVACHLLGFLGLVFPLGHIIGPLLLWLLKRDDSGFVQAQGREAVNFQISFTLWFTGAGVVAAITLWTLVLPILIGLGVLVLAIIWLVSVLTAASHASRGQAYRYPMTWRLIS